MSFELGIFADDELSADYLERLVNERGQQVSNHFSRMWDYYSNCTQEVSSSSKLAGKLGETGRYYVQAQEFGLPARITGLIHSASRGVFGGTVVSDLQRKEVVIENDIAWRINTGVDFLFGKPIRFVSRANEADKRQKIETILEAVFDANGAIGFFQDMAVLGSVYGFVDCFARSGEQIAEHISTSSQIPSFEKALELAETIHLELVEAPRALPILDESDYRKVKYYIQHFYERKNHLSQSKSFLPSLFGRRKTGATPRLTEVTEIVGPRFWQRYEDGELVGEGEKQWGFLPIVHIQNVAQPYLYEGISDVEILVPLQDELNTRLSDRASRITFQTFKMYLAKGIEGIEERVVSPGRMWCTDNPDATIEEFGGDAAMPSEDSHVAEIREAMDKTSGVTPLAAGVLKGKIGNLSSAVALRMTLMGILSKTERKQFTYGQGIKQIVRMVLRILDEANIFKTNPADRAVDILFGSALPENTMEKLQEAQIKKELGVPNEQVLKELGY